MIELKYISKDNETKTVKPSKNVHIDNNVHINNNAHLGDHPLWPLSSRQSDITRVVEELTPPNQKFYPNNSPDGPKRTVNQFNSEIQSNSANDESDGSVISSFNDNLFNNLDQHIDFETQSAQLDNQNDDSANNGNDKSAVSSFDDISVNYYFENQLVQLNNQNDDSDFS